jgi:hypothetical protein
MALLDIVVAAKPCIIVRLTNREAVHSGVFTQVELHYQLNIVYRTEDLYGFKVHKKLLE